MIYTVKECWEKACEYDHVDPKSKFVVFSDKNPWVEPYNKAMNALVKVCSEHPQWDCLNNKWVK